MSVKRLHTKQRSESRKAEDHGQFFGAGALRELSEAHL